MHKKMNGCTMEGRLLDESLEGGKWELGGGKWEIENTHKKGFGLHVKIGTCCRPLRISGISIFCDQ